jgi:hypothetical protein
VIKLLLVTLTRVLVLVGFALCLALWSAAGMLLAYGEKEQAGARSMTPIRQRGRRRAPARIHQAHRHRGARLVASENAP